MSALDEMLAMARQLSEPKAFLACHPDDEWKCREAFALMTPAERARFEFNVTTLVPSGKPVMGKLPASLLAPQSPTNG